MGQIQMNPDGPEKKKRSAAGLIILAVLGLIFVYLVGQKTHIVCTRAGESTVNCEIQSVWMGIVTISSREASGVRNAFVDSYYDSDEDSTTYRVVLRTAGKDVLVSRTFSSGNTDKIELADDINDFIKSSSRTEVEFEYKGAGGIISAIVVGVFFVVIAVGMFRSRRK